MRCIYCNSGETEVTDTRESPDGTRRRRECVKCKKRFTTYESVAESEIIVVKKDKRREKFSREKLKAGVMRACEKRPIHTDNIDKMINEIEEKLKKRGKEVPSSLIGELVMSKLKKLDSIAYIRFASVYREFKDIGDLRKEIRGLE